MAFTTVENRITFTYRDERQNTRNRVIETGGVNVFTDDDAVLHDTVSKSAIIAYQATNKQVDIANQGAAQSEVKDTLRLYFLLDDATQGHYDIVDPVDSLFLDTTGEGANILRSLAQLAVTGGLGGIALVAIINLVLAGDILIDDGETPVEFLYGKRL